MNAMTNVELNAISNVEQWDDFLFSVLADGTMIYEEIDELVIDIEGAGLA